MTGSNGPMREQRVFPRLDPPNDIEAFTDRTGALYCVAVRRERGATTYTRGDGIAFTLSHLQETVGPLTEVIDGGDQP